MRYSVIAVGLSAFLLFGLTSVLSIIEPTPVVSITVTSTNDSGPGSLRQAIADAQPNDMITFAPPVSGTILLTSGELVISKSLSIVGPGAGELKLSGNHASRVVTITVGVNVSLTGLTIADGFTKFNGGGVYNQGALTLANDVLSDNAAGYMDSMFGPSGYGGGLFSFGTVVLTGSEIHDNVGYAGGGGIYSIGGLTVTNTASYTEIPGSWGRAFHSSRRGHSH